MRLPVFYIFHILHKKINCRFVLTGLLLIGVFFMLYSAARDIRHIGSIEKISHSNDEFEFDRGEFELVKTLYFFVENDMNFQKQDKMLFFAFFNVMIN